MMMFTLLHDTMIKNRLPDMVHVNIKRDRSPADQQAIVAVSSPMESDFYLWTTVCCFYNDVGESQASNC